MNTKLNWFIVLVLVCLFVIVPVGIALANENGDDDDRDNNKGRPTSTIDRNDSDDDDEDEDDDRKENSTSTSTKSDKSQGEVNRSAVANAVQKLLEVADRDGGIGAEVRVIAREQNDSEATTTKAVKEVEDRSGLKTFLIGTDYKNLGAIRSEMVGTDNRIERLKRAADRLPAGADKTELENQIKALEEEQDKLEDFLNDNEDKFSLFGWLTRFFAE